MSKFKNLFERGMIGDISPEEFRERYEQRPTTPMSEEEVKFIFKNFLIDWQQKNGRTAESEYLILCLDKNRLPLIEILKFIFYRSQEMQKNFKEQMTIFGTSQIMIDGNSEAAKYFVEFLKKENEKRNL